MIPDDVHKMSNKEFAQWCYRASDRMLKAAEEWASNPTLETWAKSPLLVHEATRGIQEEGR